MIFGHSSNSLPLVFYQHYDTRNNEAEGPPLSKKRPDVRYHAKIW